MHKTFDKSIKTLWRPLSLSADYPSRYNAFVMQDPLEELEANLLPEVRHYYDRQKAKAPLMPALRYLPEAGLRSSQTRFDYSDAAKLLTVPVDST